MWSSLALVLVAVVLGAAWWVAATSVAGASDKEDARAAIVARSSQASASQEARTFQPGGKGSAFQKYQQPACVAPADERPEFGTGNTFVGANNDDDAEDGVLGRRVPPRRMPLLSSQRFHQTPTKDFPTTPNSRGSALGTPSSSTLRSGRHSNTADAVRLYSSPAKLVGQGSSNSQLVGFFADQERSFSTSRWSFEAQSPSKAPQGGRRFEGASASKPPALAGQAAWAAANERIKTQYEEMVSVFTAELTSAVDDAARAPREIVLGYMKAEEAKLAQAAVAAKQKRDAAIAAAAAAVGASQLDMKELRDAVGKAEEANAEDDPHVQQALAFLSAAMKISERLTSAVHEGDTGTLQKLLDGLARDERLRKLINPKNEKLQRQVDEARRLIDQDAQQRAQHERQQQQQQLQREAEEHTQQQRSQQSTARLGAGAGTQHDDESAPAFVSDMMQLFVDLEMWEQRTAHASPAPALVNVVDQCCAEVRKIAHGTADAASGSHSAVIAVTAVIERTLHESHSAGADVLLQTTMQIFRTVLEVAQSVDSLEKAASPSGIKRLYDLAHVVYSVCRVVKRGNKVFRAMVAHACPACVPLTLSQAQTISKLSTIPTLSVPAGIGLMSAAVAHGGYEAFTTDDGWKWLIRYAHLAQQDSAQLTDPAETLFIFIQLCGKEVARRVGAVHFDTAMEALRATVLGHLPGPAVGRLRSMLDTYLNPRTKRELPARHLGPMHEPYVLVSATLVESLRFYEEIAASVTDRAVKQMVQKHVRTAGNILTWEKLDQALNKVFTAMNEVRALNDDRVVKYALCFIANTVASRSELDQHSADAAPLLAAFLSQIGHALPDIPDLVRAKLYDMCPDTVPHFWPASSVTDFLVKLKQKRPKVYEDFLGDATNPTQAYESYLKLVEQYMWTFAALCVPHIHQASPNRMIPSMMTVDDAWKWLALTVNSCESEAPYHLAGVLEPFLKVAGEQLDATFTDRATGVRQFRNLLQTVHDQVVPKLDDTQDLNHTNKVRLSAILNSYIV